MTCVGYNTVYNIHVSQLQTFLSYDHPPVPFCLDKSGSTILKTIMPFMEQDITWSNEAKPVHHLSPWPSTDLQDSSDVCFPEWSF